MMILANVRKMENRRGKTTASSVRNCPRRVIGVKNLGREFQNNINAFMFK